MNPTNNLLYLTPSQRITGIAAWFGWFFNGFNMHIYTPMAAILVGQLLHSNSTSAEAKMYSSWIQAAFLVGWALGGSLFGWYGDRFGRKSALIITISIYSVFTGLCAFASFWQLLLIFRFIAALGIGGEWAIGSTMVYETLPRQVHKRFVGVLQTAVGLGILLAMATASFVLPYIENDLRWLFLIGFAPLILVVWIMIRVKETPAWEKVKDAGDKPSITSLFSKSKLQTTLLATGICSLSLAAWWAFMFWGIQHVGLLWDNQHAGAKNDAQFRSNVFAGLIVAQICGNFLASWLAEKVQYRMAVVIMCVFLFTATLLTHWASLGVNWLIIGMVVTGLFSGVFGIFTMYLPSLFEDTRLRATGSGFCFNLGRIIAAALLIFAGQLVDSKSPDSFRHMLFGFSFLYLGAAIFAWYLRPTQPDQATESYEDGLDESLNDQCASEDRNLLEKT